VVDLLREGGRKDGRIVGVRARDRLPELTRGPESSPSPAGPELLVHAPIVANVTGPWAPGIAALLDRKPVQRFALAKGCHLVTRSITRSGAVALATRQRNEGLVSRGGRHFFVIPWRGLSLIGTTNVPYRGEPAAVGVNERDVSDFLAELNSTYPGGALTRADVKHSFAGLYPLVDKEVKADVYQGAGQYEIFDHAAAGAPGLLTVIGAKYTTARNLARQAIDLVYRQRGEAVPGARTAETPVAGGGFTRLADLMTAARRESAAAGLELRDDQVADLVYNYGSGYSSVLARAAAQPESAGQVAPERPTLRAMVEHAVDREMALRLSDVIFRRTGLGTIGHPGAQALADCAAIMARGLGWDARRIEREIAAAEGPFRVDPPA
jgi:glycerol-3-phosphate dehydrogenase